MALQGMALFLMARWTDLNLHVRNLNPSSVTVMRNVHYTTKYSLTALSTGYCIRQTSKPA